MMDVERIKEIKERLESAKSDIGSYLDPVLGKYCVSNSEMLLMMNAKPDIEFLLGALVQAFEDGVNYELSGQIWENSVYVDYEQPEPPYWLSVVQ